MRHLSLFVVAFLFVSVGTSTSQVISQSHEQNPQAAKSNDAQKSAEQQKRDAVDTEFQAILDEAANSKASKQAADSDTAKKDGEGNWWTIWKPRLVDWIKRWLRDPSNVFASVVAFLTAALVGTTIALWIANNRSATIAERALTELEQPILYIRVITPGVFINFVNDAGVKKNVFGGGILKYRIVNCGRSPAMLRGLTEQITTIVKGGGFPPAPNSTPKEMGAGYYIPPSGESEDFEVRTFGHPFPSPEEAGIDAILNEAFLSITIRYADIFEKSPTYAAGFLFMLDKSRRNFVLTSADTSHNYRRKESSSS